MGYIFASSLGIMVSFVQTGSDLALYLVDMKDRK